MPLVEREISHSNATFVVWLCCFPCNILGALSCMVCGNCGKALQCACGPCLGGTLDENASFVASATLSTRLFEASHEKLLALRTEQWDSNYLFGLAGASDAMRMELYHNIRRSVLAIMNAYNFGVIRSNDLTEDELRFIGKKLQEAIFSQLPSKEDFERGVKASNIPSNDTAGLNGYLAGLITSIIREDDFIRVQLNQISADIETKRASSALIQAQSQVSMLRGLNAGQRANVNDTANPLSQAPAYGAIAPNS